MQRCTAMQDMPDLQKSVTTVMLEALVHTMENKACTIDGVAEDI